jgi:hypothetical protein
MILLKLNKKAKKYCSSEFGLSRTKNKRLYVIYNNNGINFGSRVGQSL